MATETVNVISPEPAKRQVSTVTRRRFVRRTTLYIAEYILMLVMMGGFLSLLISLWYSFFNLIVATGASGRSLALFAAGAMGAALVVGPATYWLYARVTGEEAEHPEQLKKVSRTVFLTLWTIPAVIALVSVVISILSSIVLSIFGLGGDAASLWVGRVIPGLFAAATLGFGIAVVLKHATRKLVMVSGIVLAGIAVFLLLVNLIMVVVRKDVADTPKTTTNCTYRAYLNEECTYQEYMRTLRNSSDTPSSTRSLDSLDQYFN